VQLDVTAVIRDICYEQSDEQSDAERLQRKVYSGKVAAEIAG